MPGLRMLYSWEVNSIRGELAKFTYTDRFGTTRSCLGIQGECIFDMGKCYAWPFVATRTSPKISVQKNTYQFVTLSRPKSRVEIKPNGDFQCSECGYNHESTLRGDNEILEREKICLDCKSTFLIFRPKPLRLLPESIIGSDGFFKCHECNERTMVAPRGDSVIKNMRAKCHSCFNEHQVNRPVRLDSLWVVELDDKNIFVCPVCDHRTRVYFDDFPKEGKRVGCSRCSSEFRAVKPKEEKELPRVKLGPSGDFYCINCSERIFASLAVDLEVSEKEVKCPSCDEEHIVFRLRAKENQEKEIPKVKISQFGNVECPCCGNKKKIADTLMADPEEIINKEIVCSICREVFSVYRTAKKGKK